MAHSPSRSLIFIVTVLTKSLKLSYLFLCLLSVNLHPLESLPLQGRISTFIFFITIYIASRTQGPVGSAKNVVTSLNDLCDSQTYVLERNVELKPIYLFISWGNGNTERDQDLPKVIRSIQSFI